MKLKLKYPEIEFMMRVYFNPMWIDLNRRQNLESPSDYFHVFERICEESSDDEINRLIEELNNIVHTGMSENELKRVLIDEFRGNINPPAFNSTYLEWLEKVRDYLKEGLKKK